MNFLQKNQWLIIATCLLVSACTDRTIVGQDPAGGSESASQSNAATVPVEPDMLDTMAGNTDTIEPDTSIDSSIDASPNLTPDKPGEVTTPIVASPVTDKPLVNSQTQNTVGGVSVPDTQPAIPDQQFNGNVSNSQPTENGAVTLENQQSGINIQDVDGASTPVTSEDPLLSDSTVPDPLVAMAPIKPTEPTTNTPLTNDPDLPAASGSPGMSVDCQQTLPCRWVSEDTQFTVTVTNADNIGIQGRLTIEYSVQMSHDSQIAVVSTEEAVDETGALYEPSALSLGQVTGGALLGVLAGTPVPSRVEFDRGSSADSIAQWSIGLSDTGLARQPQFTRIPIGPAAGQPTDCKNALPCTWESPEGDVTITLILANSLGSTNRLSTNFKVETTRNLTIAVDSGATAVGIDGLRYDARTHAIGVKSSATKITANTIAGAHVAGTVFFSRTQFMSPSLQHLSLVLYEDRPVPRWNPKFQSVPIQ